jgi:hypothetical protein
MYSMLVASLAMSALVPEPKAPSMRPLTRAASALMSVVARTVVRRMPVPLSMMICGRLARILSASTPNVCTVAIGLLLGVGSSSALSWGGAPRSWET